MVITNFNGANEQIKNEVNGIISEFNENEVYLNIKALLDSEELRNNFKLRLELEEVDTFSEINKLYNLFEWYGSKKWERKNQPKIWLQGF